MLARFENSCRGGLVGLGAGELSQQTTEAVNEGLMKLSRWEGR